MFIDQLSIFLENRLGRFTQIAKLFGENNINMKAFTVSENAEFGVLHIIVSNPQKACEILRANSFAASINKVVCLQTPDVPGELGKALEIISNAGVSVEYMYAYAQDTVANVFIRPDNLDLCAASLKAAGYPDVTLDDLNSK
ncbi:MAG: amino acid-binding protein [Bacteroidaceae bacterium]|nr:amino acid-binding protein [Bacteroidales bacterium]MBQ8257678.1 amino acid-binding protein [Bacteroidaceae bacterium]